MMYLLSKLHNKLEVHLTEPGAHLSLKICHFCLEERELRPWR